MFYSLPYPRGYDLKRGRTCRQVDNDLDRRKGPGLDREHIHGKSRNAQQERCKWEFRRVQTLVVHRQSAVDAKHAAVVDAAVLNAVVVHYISE